MPKQRSPDRDKAFQIYKEHNGDIPLVDIASELSISEGTVRGWKSKDRWDNQLNGAFRKSSKGSNKNKERSKQVRKETKIINKKLLDTVEENDNLTEKQKLFCVYYMQNFNATAAALRAGYSSDSAGQIGYNLLRRDDVKEEIRKLKEIKKETFMLNEADIVERYMTIAFASMNDFTNFGTEEVIEIDENGEAQKYKQNFVHFKDSSLVDGGLISEISVGRNGSNIKLADRMKALDWLGKYFLMNPLDRHKVEYENKKLELEKQKSETAIDNGCLKEMIESLKDDDL